MAYKGPPLEILINRYGMSVTAANEVPSPCGCYKGTPLGTASSRDIYWLASRKTTMKHSPEFRRGVSAARIIRAYRAEETSKKAGASANKLREPHAKQVTAHCRDCGATSYISRRILDRSSTKCLTCGGLLDSEDLPVDIYVTLKNATQLTGLAASTLLAAVNRGDIVGQKVGSRWRLTLGSVNRFGDLHDAEQARRSHPGMVRSHHVCPRCDKTFRNWAALQLHIAEQHNDFEGGI